VDLVRFGLYDPSTREEDSTMTTLDSSDPERDDTGLILVPLDGTTDADAVLVQARGLLGLPDTQLLLFTAVDPLMFRYTMRPHRGIDDLERLERNLAREKEHLEQVASALEGLDVQIETRSGVGAEAILECVDRVRPALVVLRSRARRSAPWFFGSVSRRVLRHCPAPLLVLPPEDTEQRFASLLVPLDGSETSERVLPLVARLARHAGATVTLCRFADGPHEFIESPDGGGPASHERLRSSLSRASRYLETEGVQPRVRVGMGDPATEILRVAAEEGADLVAMTTYGRSGWTRWVFGSVADQVFSRCELPLLVVRTGGPRDAATNGEPASGVS